MVMGLNMMNIMRFVTDLAESCHPYGVYGNGGFVCRQGFHCIPPPAYCPSSLRDFATLIKKVENEYNTETLDQ